MDPRLEPHSEQINRPETWPPVVIDGVPLWLEDEPTAGPEDDDEEPTP